MYSICVQQFVKDSPSKMMQCNHTKENLLSNDPDNNYSTSGEGMQKGVNFAIVCTKLVIGLNSKIY